MTGHRLPMRAMQAIVLVGLMAVIQLGLAQPASACSCGSGLTEEGELREWIITNAEAIYVARPRLADLVPGRSFRVERTLKGPLRHNLRIHVTGERIWMLPVGAPDGSRCEVSSVPLTRYLIFGNPDALDINLCTEWAIGDEVVEQAIAQLGPGTEMSWRPDLPWLAQWVVLSAGVVLLVTIAWRRFRGRRARAIARPLRDLPRP